MSSSAATLDAFADDLLHILVAPGESRGGLIDSAPAASVAAGGSR